MAFGIDLHWLPHCHGSIEVARVVKKLHPKTPVIFGLGSPVVYHPTQRITQLDIEKNRISIKPKTNEKVGPEGREEAVSAQSVVLLEMR